MRQKSGIRGSDSEKMIRTIKWKTRRQYSADGKQDKKQVRDHICTGVPLPWKFYQCCFIEMLGLINMTRPIE